MCRDVSWRLLPKTCSTSPMIVGSCCSEPSLGSVWSEWDQDLAEAVRGSARFAMNAYMIGRRCRDTCS